MSEVLSFASSDDEGFSKQDPPKKFNLELGYSYAMPFGGSYEGFSQVARRDDITSTQIMEMLENDGQVQAMYRLVTLPILSAMKTASFVPADGGEEEANFIEQMFTLPPNAGGMAIPFEKVMEQILMSLAYGFSVFELVYNPPQSTGPLKGKITLEKLAYRPSDGITFLVDEDTGKWEGVRQRIYRNGKLKDTPIPRKDVFYYTPRESARRFYGKSYFQSAYIQWDKKQRLEYMMYLAGQRSAVGFRIGKYDGNPTNGDKHDFAVMLENMSFAQAAMVPKEWEIDSLKEGGNFDFLAAINYQNSQISKSFLATFFDESQGTSSGTTPMVNFGQKTDEFFALMLRAIMDDIAAAINHYVIPKFIDWNFDSGKYPKYRWGSFTEEQTEAIRYLYMECAVAGDAMNTSIEGFYALEKRLFDSMSLDIDWKAVEERRAREEAEVERMKQQMTGKQQHLTDLHARQSGQQNPGFSDNQQQQGGNRQPNERPRSSDAPQNRR